MKRAFSSFCLFLFLGSLTAPAWAAEIPVDEVVLEDQESENLLKAVIHADSSVEANRNIILDASLSTTTLEGTNLTYEWILGDGNRQEGPEVVHSYAEPGLYEVTLILRDDQGHENSAIQEIFVFERLLTLITDVRDEEERALSFVEAARNENVFVELITNYEVQSDFLSEQNLRQEILEHLPSISRADLILVWTEDSDGLTVLSQVAQMQGNEDLFNGKSILFFSDQNFGSLKNISRGLFKTIEPTQIVLTRVEAIWVSLEEDAVDSILSILDERGIAYEIVDEKLRVKPWNILSYWVNSMIERGVPTNTLELVLILPVIATVVAFMKQVIGLETLGVYTPSILALSFIALGLDYGLFFLIALLCSGIVTKHLMRRYRLLYIPRMAIVLTIVSFTILILLSLGATFKITQIVGIAIFPMLIMSTMVEKFVSLQTDRGLKSAVYTTSESVFVAILCALIAQWNFLNILILGHPEILLLFLMADVVLARWTGLRLLEYVRFREIIRHAEEE